MMHSDRNAACLEALELRHERVGRTKLGVRELGGIEQI